jgi:hypothetical protein
LDKVFSYQSGEDILIRVDLNRSKRSKKQIKGRSEKTRSKEIKGPEQRNQDHSERQRQRVKAHCKKKL